MNTVPSCTWGGYALALARSPPTAHPLILLFGIIKTNIRNKTTVSFGKMHCAQLVTQQNAMDSNSHEHKNVHTILP